MARKQGIPSGAASGRTIRSQMSKTTGRPRRSSPTGRPRGSNRYVAPRHVVNQRQGYGMTYGSMGEGTTGGFGLVHGGGPDDFTG